MEPSTILSTIMLNFQAYGIPFISFIFGVVICDQLKLHNIESRKNLFLMAVPVSLITVGLLASSTQVEVPQDGEIGLKFGHLKDFGQYLIFNGVVMFYGTLVPRFFSRYRNSIADGEPDPAIAAPPQTPAVPESSPQAGNQG